MLRRVVRSLRMYVLIATMLFVACDLHWTSPGETTDNSIPFIYQETGDYCVPACVQMSGRFYGISVPSQQFLYEDMNGSTGGGGINGVGVQYIAPELACYGGIADAFMDHAYFGYESDQFFARQISAATYPSPVVALINSGYHAVVLNGGQWHKTTSSNGDTIYSWDSLYAHDPIAGPNQQYTGASWSSVNCGPYNASCYQALSYRIASSAPRASDYNVVTYGGSDDGGGGGGPREY
jgi:hypothetical protein